jgi:hypothetical protein
LQSTTCCAIILFALKSQKETKNSRKPQTCGTREFYLCNLTKKEVNMAKIIIAFFVAQFINVILSTIKSVITIKGGKNWAAVINAVAYGFNTIVIKSLVQVSMEVALIITIVTNLIGVYFGLWILEKLRKDQLWKITVTVPTEQLKDLKHELLAKNISFITYETKWDQFVVIDIFSHHKTDSKTIKEVFKSYNVKYTISANAGTL